MALSPKGYEYGISPKGSHPFWDATGEITGVDATVDVGSGTGTPSATVDSEYDEGVVTLNFHFDNLKGTPGPAGEAGPQGIQGIQGPAGTPGADGQDGVTPSITATATADNTSSDTPSVQVTKSGTDSAPNFAFAFSGLKGQKGDTGATGATGATGSQGPAGSDGVTPNITASATADDTSSDTPTVQVTKSGTDAAPNFAFAFSGLKGQKGDTGNTGSQGPAGQDGTTPVIGATATVDANTGTPAVQVTKTGSDAAPNFNFAFSNIKGETGPQGIQGPAGQDGQNGHSIKWAGGAYDVGRLNYTYPGYSYGTCYGCLEVKSTTNAALANVYFLQIPAQLYNQYYPAEGAIPVAVNDNSSTRKWDMLQPRLYEKYWQSQGQIDAAAFYTLWTNPRIQKLIAQYTLSNFTQMQYGQQTIDYWTVENDGTLTSHSETFVSASDNSGIYWNVPLTIDKNYGQGDPTYTFNKAETGGNGYPTIEITTSGENTLQFTYDIRNPQVVVDDVNDTVSFTGHIHLQHCTNSNVIYKHSSLDILQATLTPGNYCKYLQTVV